MYIVKIIAPDKSTNQFQVPDEFLQTENIDMMALFKRFNLDPNEVLNAGNTVLLIEIKNGIETVLHTFKKWW